MGGVRFYIGKCRFSAVEKYIHNFSDEPLLSSDYYGIIWSFLKRERPARGTAKMKGIKMAKIMVAFNASGYGSERQTFKSKDAAVESIKRDASEIADAHDGEVVDYGNGEWVVSSRSGEEIARWEIV